MPKKTYGNPIQTVLLLLCAVAAIGLIFSWPYASRWWSHRQLQLSYIDQMTLEEGDISLRDAGGYFKDDDTLQLVLQLEHDLPSTGVAGVDDRKLQVEWTIELRINGQIVHQTRFDATPKHKVILAHGRYPVYGSIQQYIDKGAELSGSVTQNGREVMSFAGRPLKELHFDDLDFGLEEGQTNLGSLGQIGLFNQPDWQPHILGDGTFKLELPGPPKPWPTNFSWKEFEKIDVQHVSNQSTGLLFKVSWNDYPRELTDKEVKEVVNDARSLGDDRCEVLDMAEVTVADIPAVQVLTKVETAFGSIYNLSRYFMSHDQRLYSLAVGGARDPRQRQADVDRFFNSFQLLDRDSELK